MNFKKRIALFTLPALAIFATVLPNSSMATPQKNNTSYNAETNNYSYNYNYLVKEKQKEENNKKLVSTAYNELFNTHNIKAINKYWAENYIQHNPNIADGLPGLEQFVKGYFTQYPNSRVEIKRLVAEGDLVTVHVHAITNPKDPNDKGLAFIDIFRVENGKVVEHWDAIQPVPTESANKNGMF